MNDLYSLEWLDQFKRDITYSMRYAKRSLRRRRIRHSREVEQTLIGIYVQGAAPHHDVSARGWKAALAAVRELRAQSGLGRAAQVVVWDEALVEMMEETNGAQ